MRRCVLIFLMFPLFSLSAQEQEPVEAIAVLEEENLALKQENTKLEEENAELRQENAKLKPKESSVVDVLGVFLPVYGGNTSKILEDGIQLDNTLGIFYNSETRKAAAEIRLRYIEGSENGTVWDTNDSLVTRSRQVLEVFLLPLSYHFFRDANGFSLYAGAGVYYDYNALNENGFLSDGDLYDPPEQDHYSAYTNDFTGHAVGPLADIGVKYAKSFFSAAASFGCVPIFYFNRKQTWKLSPFMNPNPSYTVASESSPGPYFYTSLDLSVDIQLVSLSASLLYEYSNLQYTAAGFDNTTGEWADVSEELENKNLALEIALQLNFNNFTPKIGYGRKFDTVTGGSNYFILGGVFSGRQKKGENDEKHVNF